MKQFRFALDALLRIRRRLEDRLKQEYSDMQVRVFEQKRRIEGLMDELAGTEQQARDAARQNVNVVLEKACVEYCVGLVEKISSAQEVLRQLEKELQTKREALIEARKSVRVLERLRERRYADYLKGVNRREQYFLDELGLNQSQQMPRL